MTSCSLADRYDHGLSPANPLKIQRMEIPEGRRYSVPPDMHYESHIGVVLKGRTTGRLGTADMSLPPGGIWLTPPWEIHGSKGCDPQTELLLCTFRIDCLGMSANVADLDWTAPFLRLTGNPFFETAGAEREKVLSVARELTGLVDMRADAIRAMAWLKVHELTLLIIQSFEARGWISCSGARGDFKRIFPAVELAGRAAGRTVGAEEAARACGLGKSRFEQLFRAAAGMPFGVFVQKSRAGRAAADLKNTDLTLKDIASSHGYYDESHFIRVFISFFGCRPKEYRERNRKNRPEK